MSEAPIVESTPNVPTPATATGPIADAPDDEAALTAALDEAERATDDKPKPKRGGKRAGAGRKPSTSTAKPTDPPPPFTGGPPAAEGASPASPVTPAVLAAPEELADLLVVALDGAAVALATKRYGPEMGQSVAAKEEAKASIKIAAVRFIESSAVKMTPGQALAVAILGAYVPTIVVCEMTKRAAVQA